MHLDDFDFCLPEALIACRPALKRSSSKLLAFNRASGAISDKVFHELNQLIRPNDLIIFNNTKVISARIYGKKTSGGSIECLIENFSGNIADCIVKGRNLKVAQKLIFPKGIIGTITSVQSNQKKIVFNKEVAEVMEAIGEIPIPPYFNRKANAEDKLRYQTVYAKSPGAIAAPTAGLHFDQEMLDNMIANTAQITLHVGAGTFKPVTTDNIRNHIMHSEQFEIQAECADKIIKCKQEGGRVIAVGTTVLRTIETMMQLHGKVTSCNGSSDIFITPGFKFRCVDALITNFHLPKSTLIMLISAFIGHEMMHKCYKHAIKNNYRFYSYGDAMFIT